MCAPANGEKTIRRTFDQIVAERAANYQQLKDDVNKLIAEIDALDAKAAEKRKAERKRTEKKYTTKQLEKRKAMLEDRLRNLLIYTAQKEKVKAESEAFKKDMLDAKKERIKENPKLRESNFDIDLYFSVADNCYDYLEKILFPDGIVKCRHCGHDKCYRLKTRRKHTCAKCKTQFSILKYTIFGDVRFGLPKMFKLLVAEIDDPIKLRIRKAAGKIGVSAKTAMRRLRDIRHCAFSQINAIIQAGSTLHFDTTSVIGENRNRPKYKKLSQKQTYALSTIVAGMRQLNGPAILNVIPALKTPIVHNEFRSIPKDCTVYTDGHKTNLRLSELGFTHESVNHSIGEYGRGKVNSNAAESLFSEVKVTFGAHRNCFKYVQLMLNAIAYEINCKVYELTDWEKIDLAVRNATQVMKPVTKKIKKPGQFKLAMLRSTIVSIQPKTKLRAPLRYSISRSNTANAVTI